MNLSAPFSQQLFDAFERLADGDYTIRIEPDGADPELGPISAAFNRLAAKLDDEFGTMKADEMRLSRAVEAISEALLMAGSGNLNVRVERDFKGDPIDVLAFLVESTIGELRMHVEENQRKSADIQARLEQLVLERPQRVAPCPRRG